MPGVALNITWEGRSASDFARVFDAAASIQDFRPALEEIAEEVIAPSVKENFDSGGRPDWAPLAESTVARKSRAGYSSPSAILIATGAMRAAASDPNQYRVTKDELRAAPWSIPYWVYHQSGTPNMPQRVIMMLQVADRTKVFRIFANYIRQFLIFDPRQAGARAFSGGPSLGT